MSEAPATPAAHPALKYVFLLMLGSIWGTSYTLQSLAVKTIPPITVASSRVLIGGLILLAVALAQRLPFPRDRRTWLAFFAFGVAGQALPFSLITAGQAHVDSGLTSILCAITPLFTLLLAHFFTRDERISPPKLAGLALAFAGIVLLVGPSALEGLGRDFWAQMSILAGAFFFAVSIVVARATRHVPFAVSASCSLLCGAVAAVPTAAIVDRPWTTHPSIVSLAACGVLAVLGTAIGMMIFFRLIKLAGSNFVSLNNYLAPAIAVLLGVAFLGERLTWPVAGAIALIFAGIAVASLRGRQIAPRAP